MINLLPDSQKEILKENQKMTRIVILFGEVVTALVVFLFLIYGVSFLVEKKTENAIERALEKIHEIRDLGHENFQTLVKVSNEDLKKIHQFREREIFLGDLIKKISYLLPKDVYLTELSFQKVFDKDQEKKWRVTALFHLSGVAGSRKDLFDFKTNLEGEKSFEEVFFTPSSWVAPLNAPFSLTFKVKLKND